MFRKQDESDLSSDDLPLSYLQENSPWSRINEKFRCVILDFKLPTVISFLESLLTFMRRHPKNSRQFTRSVCKYLFAIKTLASTKTVDESYYGLIRKVLLIYCVIELRLLDCFDDDSMVASDILLKITLLMKGSSSITVLDVLIDIDEHIQNPRSVSVMGIVYRKYLTETLSGPSVLNDISFVKNLILFRSWYAASEALSEKVFVFKMFMATMKPPRELRSNRSFEILHIYDEEADDYKKLLIQPLPKRNLVRALKDAERIFDDYDNAEHAQPLDLQINADAQPKIKVEVDLSLNLPDEIILVDDDDISIMEISYLAKLLKRLDDVTRSLHLIAVRHDSLSIENIKELDCDGNNDDDTVTMSTDTTTIRPILRGFSKTTYRKRKAVTFKDPLTTQHVLERCDSDDEWLNVNATSDSDLSNDSGSETYATCVSECASTETTILKKSRKRKRSHFTVNSRSSLDSWMKRKKLVNKSLDVLTTTKVAPKEINAPVPKRKELRIILSRCDSLLNENKKKKRMIFTGTSVQQSIQHVRLTRSVTSNKNSCKSYVDHSTSSKPVLKKKEKSFKEPSASKLSKSATPSIEKKLAERKAHSPAHMTIKSKNQGCYETDFRKCSVVLNRLKGIAFKPKKLPIAGSIKSKAKNAKWNGQEIFMSNTSVEYQKSRTVLVSTSKTPQFEIDVQQSNNVDINQPSTSSTEVECTTIDSNQLECTPEVNNCSALDDINCMWEIVGESASCSTDDTTTLLTLPNISTDYVSIKPDPDNNSFVPMWYDDIDIPSPEYSPHRGLN